MSDTLTQVKHGADKLDDTISRPALALILLILGVSYLFNGMDRQMLPALLGQINADYHLTLAEGGFLSTAFAFNIALFGALSGWCMKRFGRRATLVGGLLAYSLFTFLTPLASDFAGLAIYRALTGAGEALHICAIFSCVGAYFGAQRGAAMGVINASFGVGAYLGPVLGTLLYEATGSWHTPFYAYGVAGAVAALLVLLFVPKHFSEARDLEGVTVASSAAPGGPTRVFNRNLVVVSLAFAMMGVSFFSFTALYAVFLRTQLHYPVAAAGATLGMYGIGSLFGLVGGWLGDRLRTPGMLVATLLLAVTGHLLFHGPASQIVQGALSFTFGVLVSGYLYPRCISVLQRNVPARDVSLAVSIGLPFFYVPGMAAGYFFGHLVDRLGWSVGATLMLTLPPLLAFLLLLAYQARRSREVSGAAAVAH
ncbi:MFS transporter (plasmid) [Caballeronia sp. NK8]|uniref:MFS transporter n=1 Tax=Caballeronia sp. NK8 TaxID=140098 RepID=UPI001BB6A578|nr:MFS transporter [Caballeronia sp. NK8]BCQ28144.1 MFS transporter [Caballeronia sp. NK8]